MLNLKSFISKLSGLLNKKKNHILELICITVFFLIIIFLIIGFPDYINIPNNKFNDMLFKLRLYIKGNEQSNPFIVFVDYDNITNENSYDLIQERIEYSKLIHILTKLNCHSIIIDTIFNSHSQKEIDDELAENIKKSNKSYQPIILKTNKYSIKNTIFDKNGFDLKTIIKNIINKNEKNNFIFPMKKLMESSKGIGFINCKPDKDGIYRKFPLFLNFKNKTYSSLTLSFLLDFLKIKTENIKLIHGKFLILNQAKLPGGMIKDIKIPLDKNNNIIINYTGTWKNSFKHYSGNQLINIEENSDEWHQLFDELEDTIIVLSNQSWATKDIGSTPLETIYPLTGIHANIINSVLTDNHIRKTSLFENIIITFILLFFFYFIILKNRKIFNLIIFSVLLIICFLIFHIMLFLLFNIQSNLFFPYVNYISFSLIVIILIRNYNRLIELNRILEYKVEQKTEHLIKANKKISESEKEKTDFFLNLSHEIKTPLTLLANYYNNYIKSKDLTEELIVIKENIDKLLNDMNNFFDILKIEKKGELYKDIKIINFSQYLDTKIKIFKEYALSKNIKIKSEIQKNIFLKIDPAALERIINNIIDNALKYNKKNGRIKIILKEKNNNIILNISDTGIGIPKDKLKNIFLPYYQLSHKKKNIQGIGLGLSIIKNIIQKMNGKIIIESEVGKGTIVNIIFSRYDIKKSDRVIKIKMENPIIQISKKTKTDITQKTFSTKSVLIVENNKNLLKLLKKEIGKTFNILNASNGKEALKLLRKNKEPDIILSDIMMDEMDGYEFLKNVNKNDKLKHIPFLFMTAKSTFDEKLKALDGGAVDYIFKPFVVEELIYKISSIIRQQELKKSFYEKEKFTSIGMILSGISHEIYNPLSGIYAPIEIIKKSIITHEKNNQEKALKFLDYIKNNVERIEKIIKLIDSVHTNEHIEKENIHIYENIGFMLDKNKSNKNIKFINKVPKKTVINTNTYAFEQIIKNLISNGIDAIENSGSIKIEYIETKKNKILQVSDTGKGIKKEYLNQIFNAFYTTKDPDKGTGIGLYIVQNLVKKMNWEINVESTINKGTSFSIFIKD